MTVPNNDGFVGASVTEDEFKQNLVQLLDHIRSLTSGFDLKNGKVYDFASMLDFEAIKTKIPAGSIVVIEWGEEYGAYVWDGNNLTKSQYDLLALAKSDASNKAELAKNDAIHTAEIDAQIKADDAEKSAKEFSALLNSNLENSFNNFIADIIVSLNLIGQSYTLFLNQYDNDQNGIFHQISDMDLKILALDEHNLNLISNLIVSNHQLSKLIDTVHRTFVNTDDVNQDQFSHLVVANSQITMLIKSLQQSVGLVDDQHNDQLSKLVTTVHSINQILTTLTEQAIVKPMLNSVFVFPEPQSIAVIDIATDSALPNTKEDGMKPCRVTIDIDGQIAKVYAKFGVQGQSSAGFPKKNWSFDFYKDAAGSSSFDIKIGAVKAQDSFNFKANFIDHLHVRQMFNLELWQQIQNSRKGYPKQDIDNYYIGKTGKDAVPTGATAAPYMYPAVCNVNGEFYGVGCIHYAKKRSNYNIAKNKPKEILIDFGGITSIDEMDPAIIEIKAPSSPTAETLASIERWRTFAQSSSENIAANHASYLSKQNIIDYYCYVDFICGADIVFKNLMMYSWDGNIWRIGVYDVDMTYGLDFDGTVTRFTPTYDAFQGNGFWDRIHIAFQTDIEARYAELRRLGLFSVDHVYLSMSHLLSFYPSDLLSAEYAKWNPPSLTQTTFAALLEWVKQRLVFLDAKHNYTGN
ncbi:CotH kinase family protein [Acinetobacter junii]|uniref:CotH kinase family protein n=1 Tax=Acinetobacter junii TaxID=40215 RepID=A0AAW5RAY1_ACIJU|nr:CotH kinase family protein [Acinetobacter junii]MCU4397062.1 CotH kinase family protein [Acinetobacter junii]